MEGLVIGDKIGEQGFSVDPCMQKRRWAFASSSSTNLAVVADLYFPVSGCILVKSCIDHITTGRIVWQVGILLAATACPERFSIVVGPLVSRPQNKRLHKSPVILGRTNARQTNEQRTTVAARRVRDIQVADNNCSESDRERRKSLGSLREQCLPNLDRR